MTYEYQNDEPSDSNRKMWTNALTTTLSVFVLTFGVLLIFMPPTELWIQGMLLAFITSGTSGYLAMELQRSMSKHRDQRVRPMTWQNTLRLSMILGCIVLLAGSLIALAKDILTEPDMSAYIRDAINTVCAVIATMMIPFLLEAMGYVFVRCARYWATR